MQVVQRTMGSPKPHAFSALFFFGWGSWDLAAYLDYELWMPFQEPRILHHSSPLDFSLGPNFGRERAMTNVLLFKFLASDFFGPTALSDPQTLLSCRTTRANAGDMSGKRNKSIFVSEVSQVYPFFKSLFQGDHLGDEFALSSHAALLEEAGLLQRESRILGGSPFPFRPLYEGLVIDDYFVLSVQKAPATEISQSLAVKCFEKAVKHYDAVGVLRSPEKDIAGSSHLLSSHCGSLHSQ